MAAAAPALPAAEIVGEGLARTDWLDLRRKGIGGSDIGGILGISPWTSPLSVWQEKRGLIDGELDTDAIHWGRILEEPIRQKFERETGETIRRLPEVTMYRNLELPIAQFSPDGLLGEQVDAIFEAKSSSPYAETSWWDPDDPEIARVPSYYEAQAQWGMAVLGKQVERVEFGVFLGTHDFRTFVVMADPELQALMFERAEEFWRLVESGIQPDIDGLPGTTAAINRRFSTAEPGAAVEGGAELAALVARLREAKAFCESAEQVKDEIENQIKALLGTAETGLVDGDRVVSWKQQTRRSAKLERVARVLTPEQFAEVVETSTFRVLRPKKG